MMVSVGEGRFTRDPELKPITKADGSTTSVCEFSLAVDERMSGKKFTHFFDFCVWDSAAETIVKYCKKGDSIMVQCTPRQDKWKTAEGDNRSRIVFRVNEFKFLGKARANREDNEENSDNF